VNGAPATTRTVAIDSAGRGILSVVTHRTDQQDRADGDDKNQRRAPPDSIEELRVAERSFASRLRRGRASEPADEELSWF